MNVLGLYGAFNWDANKSFFTENEDKEATWLHDSGASLFVNGSHIVSISEERLSKIKYEGNFPFKSINYCLDTSKLLPEDIDIVVIPSTGPEIFYKKVRSGDVENTIKKVFPNAKVKFYSHHQCHAFSSIFTSDFNEGCVFVADGTGSLICSSDDKEVGYEVSTIGYFNKEKNIFRFFPYPSQVNTFATFYSGWSHTIYTAKTGKNISELQEEYREALSGKVMGLSAYGKDAPFIPKMFEVSYFDMKKMPYVTFLNTPLDYKFTVDEVAYIVQKNFEDALVSFFTSLKQNNYLEDNLCLAGGAFLNVLGNSRLVRENLVKKIHIPPFPSDVGLHFGAAAYESFLINKQINLPINQSLLGRVYSEEEIKLCLESKNCNYTFSYNILDDTTKFLEDQKIVGWFQGRSEFGPRALGSRSILMLPNIKENKDILNIRVKHREEWRPFAGVVVEERLRDYFDDVIVNNPYMLYSLNVKKDKAKYIPAIVHNDGTCRIQTVNENQNKLLYDLLNRLSVPVLLNTSFNDNGQPIVETPEDAIDAFFNMDIDVLVIGNYIVKKP